MFRDWRPTKGGRCPWALCVCWFSVPRTLCRRPSWDRNMKRQSIQGFRSLKLQVFDIYFMKGNSAKIQSRFENEVTFAYQGHPRLLLVSVQDSSLSTPFLPNDAVPSWGWKGRGWFWIIPRQRLKHKKQNNRFSNTYEKYWIYTT